MNAGAVVGGKYRIEAQIGAGGMGRVFAAEHLLLKRPVALKLLPEASGSAHRLMREARAAQTLRSEHIILVYDVGLEEGTPYIVMELLEGRNLAQLAAERGPLPVAEAVDHVIQACVGLSEAHGAGIVHRDVKPSNLFLTRRPTGEPLLKILDFGISKTPFAEALADERTAEGTLLGSPHYMSPEQLRHPSRVDARTDVWSLAVTLYTLVAGRRPFEGETLVEVGVAIATEAHRPVGSLVEGVPPALDAALSAALAKRPEDRTPSVAALAHALGPLASASGRAHLARIAPAPPPPTSVPSAGADRTLAPTDRTVTEHRPAARRSRRRAVIAAATVACVAIAASVAALYARTDRRSAAGVPPSSSAAAPRVPPPAPPSPAPAAPAPQVRAEKAPVRTPPARRRERGAPRPVDIDGIPIIE